MPTAHFSGADVIILAACFFAMAAMTIIGPGQTDKFDARHPPEQETYKPVSHRAPLLTVCLILAVSAVVYVLMGVRQIAG